MVSFHAAISSNCGKKVENSGQNLSNKRKIRDKFAEEKRSPKKSKPDPSSYSSALDSPELEAPLPLDWQRCLNVQSGKVHFYNRRTETRTSTDPREGPRGRPAHMRLELELNLPCDSKIDQLAGNDLNSKREESYNLLLKFDVNNNNEKKNINSSQMSSSTAAPSWLAFDGDEKSEMVATVCKRCFMLVMLCKFMHSPDQSAPLLFKRSLTQLLY